MNLENRQLQALIEELLNNTITRQGHDKLQEMLKQDEALHLQYFRYIDLDSELRRKFDPKSQLASEGEHSMLPGSAITGIDLNQSRSRRQQQASSESSFDHPRKVIFLAALLSIAATVFLALWVSERTKRSAMSDVTSVTAQSSADDKQVRQIESTPPSVVLSNAIHATFFDGLSPRVGRQLRLNTEHVLQTGMIELTFQCGAITIIESPAVFRPVSRDRLAVTLGSCSVYAPPGAEGFLIETPFANVVDRGTRFSLQVNESADAEVHVIEGVAEVSPKEATTDSLEALTRLVVHESIAVTGENAITNRIEFRRDTYRSQLPDRIISYQATIKTNDRVEELESITVQRSGEVCQYNLNELILAELISFKATERAEYTSDLNIVGPAKLSSPRRDYLSDKSLTTGIINPGGAKTPAPVASLKDCEATPGFAIRFNKPIVNGAGPDIAFFEFQTAINPAGGDPFHVIPIGMNPSQHPVTIKVYDLDMRSPDALYIAPFHEYKMGRTIEKLIDLEEMECKGRLSSLTFKAVCAGIDLSDMGYAVGDSVQELFFQDASEDSNSVDPVMICGFPKK